MPSAGSLHLAIAIATVAVSRIAIFAVLAGGQDAVTAAGRQAIAVAAVAAGGIIVVAFLVHIEDAVAAVGRDLDRTPSVATVPVGCVAVIALFRIPRDSV